MDFGLLKNSKEQYSFFRIVMCLNTDCYSMLDESLSSEGQVKLVECNKCYEKYPFLNDYMSLNELQGAINDLKNADARKSGAFKDQLFRTIITFKADSKNIDVIDVLTLQSASNLEAKRYLESITIK
jgi:hypothetical protein